ELDRLHDVVERLLGLVEARRGGLEARADEVRLDPEEELARAELLLRVLPLHGELEVERGLVLEGRLLGLQLLHVEELLAEVLLHARREPLESGVVERLVRGVVRLTGDTDLELLVLRAEDHVGERARRVELEGPVLGLLEPVAEEEARVDVLRAALRLE